MFNYHNRSCQLALYVFCSQIISLLMFYEIDVKKLPSTSLDYGPRNI